MRKQICFVHDWLVQIAGAEHVLIELLRIYPTEVFTLFYCENTVKEIVKLTGISKLKLQATFLQKVPKVRKLYKSLLPLFPLAIESLNLNNYDIVFSLSHAIAKGVKTHRNQLHICYCHTPMRYIWHLYDSYYNYGNYLSKMGLKLFRKYLQKWDVKTSKNVDIFLVPSTAVKERVRKIYNRNSIVVPPPVNVDKFNPSFVKDKYFIFVGRLDIPYKKVNIVIEAFSKLKDQKLIVVGSGSDEQKLKEMASSNIEFVGWKTGDELINYISKARALILPSEEDFGLVSVEAQACATPVIAYGKGGAIDTVIDGKTGVLFYEQTVEALISAIDHFLRHEDSFDLKNIRKNSLKFSSKNFQNRIKSIISKF
jgi:glycosyltransferase involved in cell wall biosynthesis